MMPCNNICHEYICVEMFFFFLVNTSFVKLFIKYISIVVMFFFFSISQNMDVIVAILPFIAPFGMLMFFCENDMSIYGQFCLYD